MPLTKGVLYVCPFCGENLTASWPPNEAFFTVYCRMGNCSYELRIAKIWENGYLRWVQSY